MTCKSCARWNLRESGKMAEQGFAVCDLDKKFTFYGLDHHCDRFKELEAGKVKARIVWLDKKMKG